jgi:nucleoside-diphosphate-sugar epimerase
VHADKTIDMASLFCFGLGYCALHYLAEFGRRFDCAFGTTRTKEKAIRIARENRVRAFVFDSEARADLTAAIADSDAMLTSVAPTETGDPVLAVFSQAIATAPKLKCIVYLSTVGVYGDHRGAWVDENTIPNPASRRGQRRLEAEHAWRRLGQRAQKSVAVLRLAGIYGPGRNALAQLRAGTAKRIIKRGQVFGRVHVADIAAVIDKAFTLRADGIFNVVDDEPAPPQDVISFAADLLGIAPPPDIPFEEAAKTLSPMALSFYSECRRAQNERVKHELGVTLRYPTYRDGLRALRSGE